MKFKYLHKIIVYYLEVLAALIRYRKTTHVNTILNYGGISIENLPFILFAKLIRYRLIVSIEEDYSFFTDDIKTISKFKFWTVRRLDFLNCKWSDAIMVVSTFLKEKYLKKKQGKVYLIPVTARINHNSNKKKFNSPLKIIYAGSFADKDGVRDIIEGFCGFNEFYEDARLILTGKSEQQDSYREEFKDKTNIQFPGFIPDNEFYEMLRDSDILCMCRTESDFANAGFPFKLGEYLATGNPVICTRVSDVEIYLTDNDAFLIEPRNPGQIRDTFIEIISDPERARNKGLAGLKKCQMYFSPEVNGKLFYDVINKVAYS